MQIKGLMLDPVTNVPIVILRDEDGQRVLPIWVGPAEANAIALQIENLSPPRPMTHDLLRDVVGALGVTVSRVIISDLKGSTYYAYLELRQGEDVILVDARPSDALALAARTRAPIFVQSAVLDQEKSLDVATDQADQDRLQRWLESLDPDDMGYKM
ncbi:MAG TPA: bifunctional nuclease family protein [Vicinamibacterales bacterium]|nr:bifunctional nuclease family protein [Vicinamibacterales bacterium]